MKKCFMKGITLPLYNLVMKNNKSILPYFKVDLRLKKKFDLNFVSLLYKFYYDNIYCVTSFYY